MALRNSIIMNYTQMENVKTIEINKLLVMFIIAMGEWNGSQWEYFPKLPSCFTQHIMFPNRFYADFLCLRVNSSLEVEVWFVTTEKETKCISFGEIERSQPHLFASLITHVFDMIENVKEC